MINQFSRTELILGKDATKVLKEKVVAVFGLGGVGGNACDSLVRAGIGHIVIIDNDTVNVSNINRQLIANHDNIGMDKVDAMEKHLLSINPELIIEKKKMFYLPDNNNIDFSKFDYVVDAIDTVSAKLDIIVKCQSLGVPVISALGCGNKMNPTLLEVSDISKTSYDPLAKVMRRELKRRNINHLKVVYSKEQPLPQVEENEEETVKNRLPGSTPFVPPVAGIIIAGEVAMDLLKRKG